MPPAEKQSNVPHKKTHVGFKETKELAAAAVKAGTAKPTGTHAK